jgi:hypothetical protein
MLLRQNNFQEIENFHMKTYSDVSGDQENVKYVLKGGIDSLKIKCSL